MYMNMLKFAQATKVRPAKGQTFSELSDPEHSAFRNGGGNDEGGNRQPLDDYAGIDSSANGIDSSANGSYLLSCRDWVLPQQRFVHCMDVDACLLERWRQGFRHQRVRILGSKRGATSSAK